VRFRQAEKQKIKSRFDGSVLLSLKATEANHQTLNKETRNMEEHIS
jgi:hypothetical protein